MHSFVRGFPGFLLVVFLTVSATVLAEYLSLNSILIAIVLGFVVANVMRIPQHFKVGIKWVESYALAVAVALLGVQLDLHILMQITPTSLVVIGLSIILTFGVTLLVSKILKVGNTESCLLASGQAICGTAAVMAASQSMRVSNSAQTALVIAVINFLGFLGVFVIPWLLQAVMQYDEVISGFVIGNTLQSMGHVAAAGFSVNDAVGQGAVLIKMCRILFLIPTLLLLVFYFSRLNKPPAHSTDLEVKVSQLDWLKWIPLFIWGFLALVAINSLGWVSPSVELRLTDLGDLLFVLAMAAIGLNIQLQDMWQQAGKILLLGGLVFILQIGFTLLAVGLL